MKNILIIVIVLILAVLGVMYFSRDKADAPSLAEEMEGMEDMGGMEPTDVSAGYNTPVTVDPNATVKEFVVDGKNFSFAPSALRVKQGDTVKITLKNTQGFHDLVIDEYKVATKQIRTGEEDTITFVADKKGSFEYYCSVGTHRAMGMLGTLLVE